MSLSDNKFTTINVISMNNPFFNILLAAKSLDESLLVGLAVGAVTFIIVIIFTALKKTVNNVGQKSKEARKIKKNTDQIE